MPGRVFKRGNTYHISFSYKGTEYRKSALTDKKREAENLLAFYLGQCARNEFKGFQQETSLLVTELLDMFENDCKRRKLRGLNIIHVQIGHVRRYFEKLEVSALTELQLERYITHRLDQGRSTTTVNRELQHLGHALRLAKQKKLIIDIPLITRFREDNARQGFFEHEEFEALVSFLPEYLKDFTRFAYLSAWRKNEITTLEWRDVSEGVIRLRPEHSKTKEGRLLILVGELAEIIEHRRLARIDLIPWVFHRDGIQVNDFRDAWKTACKQARIQGKLFHDLRRTAVRNMVRAGVPEKIAMSISGHTTRIIFDRYNIVNEQDIRQGLEQTQAYLKTAPHTLRRIGHQTDIHAHHSRKT